MKVFLLFTFAGLMIFACSKQAVKTDMVMDGNPFFTEWKTPFGTPPFQLIKNEHYMPAFNAAIAKEKEEIRAIIDNSEVPTFDNTIAALDFSGEMLSKVNSVFGSLNESDTNEEMQEIAKEVAPMLTKHRDNILLNAELFKRIKSVYEQRDKLDLTTEQYTVLDKYYKDFVRGGANLSDEKKDELRNINEELAVLSEQFGENVLKETNATCLVIDNEEDLAGLPKSVIDAAKEAAESKGETGKWVITLHKPSWIPFLQYSDKRKLREKIYRQWFMIGDNNNANDNKKILSRMSALRQKRAELLGYKTHAHLVLESNMAKVPENVYELLQQLWEPAIRMAKKERDEFQAMANKEGNNFKLQSWDWWYYAEKVRKEKFALDDNMLRPYFKVENVIKGAFDIAGRLFNITFAERKDIPVYHEDVKVWEIKEADGTHVGILYTDYFPRASKRGGAWSGDLREQSKKDGKMVHPIIYNVGNFSKPTADTPSLLTIDEVRTLFHELGHALHDLLSQCTYPRVAGTSVSRDFVELPSQIMENWAVAPEVLKTYAVHYQTGEPIPDELIDKMVKSGYFNQGFGTSEYLAASFLDMDWHTITTPEEHDVIKFENASMKKIGLIPEILPRYRSTYFRHIYAGGYASGYYSYIWAEVLDSDAFEAFKEIGLFDRKTAMSFRENILERGGTEDPMVLYKRFRGAEPKIDALLKKRGLK
ncbi:M3 family metallopeptidase [candidate division KSB1 bacterium]